MNSKNNEPDLPDKSLGEPITELRDVREFPRGDFAARVEREIERRRMGSDLLGMCVVGVGAVLREWVAIAAEILFGPGNGRKS